MQYLGALILGTNQPKEQETLGYSVAVSGDSVVAGAPGNYYIEGAAFVFARDAGSGLWLQQGKLSPKKSSTADTFGRSVSIDGDWVIVGCAGTATIYRRSNATWSLHTTLTGTTYGADSSFGHAVSILGDRAAVLGARTADGKACVFVFAYTDPAWALEAAVDAQNCRSGVALDGDRLIVGGGGGRVFARNGSAWSLDGTLAAPSGVSGSFGYASALSGDYAAIGGPASLLEPGHVQAYSRVQNAWTPGPLIEGDVSFGMSVALHDDRMLVGRVDGPNPRNASIFLRQGDDWIEVAQIVPSGIDADPKAQWFGWSVALSERYAVVGAFLGTMTQPAQGFVYITDMQSPPTFLVRPGAARFARLLAATVSDGDVRMLNERAAHVAGAMPSGVYVVLYRSKSRRLAITRELETHGARLQLKPAKSVGALLRQPDATLLISPSDERDAVEWLRAHRDDIERVRRAPAILMLSLDGPGYKRLLTLRKSKGKPRRASKPKRKRS